MVSGKKKAFSWWVSVTFGNRSQRSMSGCPNKGHTQANISYHPNKYEIPIRYITRCIEPKVLLS